MTDVLPPKRHRMVPTWVTQDSFARLEAEAHSRDLPPEVLAAMVLETVAKDGLFLAVLDGR